MAIVKATEHSEAGGMPDLELVAKMGKFNEELMKAGALLDAEGLQPSSKGTRITFSGPKPTVVDGPFAETKELINGFWLLSLKSKEEAIEWLLRCPFKDGEQVEIRQVYETEDFGPELKAVFDEQERRREQLIAERSRS
jgi:hypothetical protein